MPNIVYLGTLFLLSCLLYIPCEAAVENIPCTSINSSISSCDLYGNAVCGDTSTCRCRDNYYDDVEVQIQTCRQKINIDAPCSNTGSCKDPLSTCIQVTGRAYQCTCNSGYYNNAGTCSIKLESGVTCTRDNDATECVSNAMCKSVSSSLKCTCNTGYYDDNFDNHGGLCRAEIALGGICTVSGSAIECVPYSTCMSVGSDLKCQCSLGYYDNDVNPVAGTCVPELQSGVRCTRDNDATECVPNAVCKAVGSDLMCTCNTGYYDDNFSATGGQCAAEIALSEKCTQENDQAECMPNAVCQSDGSELQCTCSSGYYDSNFADSGGTCTLEKESGVTCTLSKQPTECVPNAVCQGGVCTCKTGYYDDNFNTGGGQCIPELESGVTCTRYNDATECVPNAECKSGGSGLKCTCNTGYYDDNFSNTGGKCVSEIALGGICTEWGSADECVSLSTCTSVGSDLRCKCSLGHYDNDINPAAGTCVRELESGVTCARVNDATECVPNSECKSGGSGLKCTCNTGYYDNNFRTTGGQCAAEIALSEKCTQEND